jgi:hypothetical protein
MYPGYEHLKWQVTVKEMQAERLFSFNWHPFAVDPKVDYSKETPTLVSFQLEGHKDGTLLTVTESGFENVPSGRMPEAFRMNTQGWAQQMINVDNYVTGAK